jgi:hypothetical protein
MSIPIKQIPILTGKVASDFITKSENNLTKKHTIDFSLESEMAKKILKKAKL